MRLVRDLLIGEKPMAMVITGDGKWEDHIIKPLFELHDGTIFPSRSGKVFWFPFTTSPYRKRRGLDSLQQVKIILGKYEKVERFLAVLDLEHIGGRVDEEERVEEKVREKLVGFFIEEIEPFRKETEWLVYVKAKVGNRKAEIYIAIVGLERNMHECVGRLYELQTGKKIEVENVQKELHGKKLEELILKAKSCQLSKCFPALLNYLTLESFNCAYHNTCP